MFAGIADVHFGRKKGAYTHYRSTMDLFREQLIPDLRSKGINDLWIFGDLFDVRETINIRILMGVYNLFKTEMRDFNIHILIGNHDIYLQNSIEVNAPEVLEALPNVTVYKKQELVDINGKKVLVQPWLIDGKVFEKQVDEMVENAATVDAVFGHFDIMGFKQIEYGTLSTGKTHEAVDPKCFAKITEKVYTGHFHPQSEEVYSAGRHGKVVIRYLGATEQHNFGDAGAKRGYTIFNDDLTIADFIENEVGIKYVKLQYPDEFERCEIEGNYVELLVEGESAVKKPGKFDKYMVDLNECQPLGSVNINYDNSLVREEVDIDGDYSSSSIDALIVEYITSIDDMEDREAILQMLIERYERMSN
jgi:DNA repair exonuclease SbcCD nuclease subunit